MAHQKSKKNETECLIWQITMLCYGKWEWSRTLHRVFVAVGVSWNVDTAENVNTYNKYS